MKYERAQYEKIQLRYQEVKVEHPTSSRLPVGRQVKRDYAGRVQSKVFMSSGRRSSRQQLHS